MQRQLVPAGLSLRLGRRASRSGYLTIAIYCLGGGSPGFLGFESGKVADFNHVFGPDI